MTESYGLFDKVVYPTTWAQSPTPYPSFSFLQSVEECPLQWSLKRSEYPQIWDGNGYPSQVRTGQLVGTIVHNVIDLLASKFALEGSSSPEDKNQVLRELGGFKVLIERELIKEIDRHNNNPRVSPKIRDIEVDLRQKISEMRLQLQKFVKKMPSEIISSRRSTAGNEHFEIQALSYGTYSEITLTSRDPDFIGIIDLLLYRQSECEILDYKTGVPKETHRDQLLTYAWLWEKDELRNPRRSHVNKLTIRYPDHDEDVPVLSSEDRYQFNEELCQRISLALERLNQVPPEAIPSEDACNYCDVKHLCDSYWEYINSQPANDAGYGDCQIMLSEQISPTIWRAVCESSDVIPRTSEVIVKFNNESQHYDGGATFRLINVSISMSPENSYNVSLTRNSESYFLPG